METVDAAGDELAPLFADRKPWDDPTRAGHRQVDKSPLAPGLAPSTTEASKACGKSSSDDELLLMWLLHSTLGRRQHVTRKGPPSQSLNASNLRYLYRARQWSQILFLIPLLSAHHIALTSIRDSPRLSGHPDSGLMNTCHRTS